MIQPAFVIFSASRCGSTALLRALNLIPGCSVVYEPGFSDIELHERPISKRVTELLEDNSGFKHVFDPIGYPFRDIDWAPIEEMERDRELWIRLNAAILNHPGIRVVFLGRRDGFERAVSDQFDKFTHLGDYWKNGISPDEAARYRASASQLPLPLLDEPLIRWYLENLPGIQDRLRAATTNPVFDVWYEDVFGWSVGVRERIEKFKTIVEFLGISVPRGFFNSKELYLLFRPAAKLNDASTLERIPNYREVRAKLGIPESITGIREPPQSDGASFSDSVAAPGQNTTGPVTWRLRAAGDNVAGLSFPADRPDALRVEIAKTTTPTRHDIQLNLLHLKIAANRPYMLEFRARADRPRSLSVGVAQAHAPWMNLGLYEEIALTPDWLDFQRVFVPNAGDEQVRIHFDLGMHADSVEISHLRLIEPKTSFLADSATTYLTRTEK